MAKFQFAMKQRVAVPAAEVEGHVQGVVTGRAEVARGENSYGIHYLDDDGVRLFVTLSESALRTANPLPVAQEAKPGRKR